MATPITSLTSNDTFQTWFNTTNTIISTVNGITTSPGGITGPYVISFNGLTGEIIFTNYVSDFNGRTGSISGLTGTIAGNGITITGSSTYPTISNGGVLSVNGASGVVQNIAVTNAAQVFQTLQEFIGGISANGATFSGNISAPNIITTTSTNAFTNVQTFNAGVSAAGSTFSGNVTITGSLSAPNIVNSFNGRTGALQGVSAISGTANQITVSGATGDVVISLPSIITGVTQISGATLTLRATNNAIPAIFTMASAIGSQTPNSTLTGNFSVSGGLSANSLSINTGINALGGINAGSYTGNLVNSFNGFTGAVSITAGSGIGITTANRSLTVSNTGVLSFNGLTGAVSGVTTSTTNTFTAPQRFNAGISAAGSTFTSIAAGNIYSNITTPNYPLNINNIVGSITSIGDQTDTVMVIDAVNHSIGITAGSGVIFNTTPVSVSDSSITVVNSVSNAFSNLNTQNLQFNNGNISKILSPGTFVGSTNRTISLPPVTSNTTLAAIGLTQAFTGLQTFNNGISASDATFSGNIYAPNIVTSFNGITGAVSGVTTTTANTFTALQTFTAGIFANGATFSGPISATNLITTTTQNNFTALQRFSAGLSASDGTFMGGITVEAGNLGFSISKGKNGVLGCIAIGGNALGSNTNGLANTAIGNNALQNTTTGGANTGVGFGILTANISGSNNTGVGASVLPVLVGGDNNTGVGVSVFGFVTNGSNNIGIGYTAGGNLVGVTNGVFIGVNTTAAGTTSINEIVIGAGATGLGSNTAVIGNDSQQTVKLYGTVNATSGITAPVAVFTQDISVNGITIGRGASSVATNTVVSSDGLPKISTASNNTAFGYRVLRGISTGFYNTGIGSGALSSSDCNGSLNVGVGYNALSGLTSGSSNTAIGNSALQSLKTGFANVAVGHNALLNLTSSEQQNIAIGYQAGAYRGTASSANFGASAGIYLGYQARASANNQTNEIVIGADAVGAGSNTAVIGATLQQAARIYGVLYATSGITAPGATFNGNIYAPNIVTSFNGITGAVSGVTTTTANTFTALQTFTAGIFANGATFSGPISAPNLVTTSAQNNFTALQYFPNGLSASVVSVTDNFNLKGILTVGTETTIGEYGDNTNVGIGAGSLVNCTEGANNISIGVNSLGSIISSTDNTAIGAYALGTLEDPSTANTAIGSAAMFNSTGTNDNTAIGKAALYTNVAAQYNTAIGSEALFWKLGGNFNTAIGWRAGYYRGSALTGLQGATGGVFIGTRARASAENQTNEIVIGYDAVGLGSNTAVIGATLQQAATIYGQLRVPGGLSTAGATFSGPILSTSGATFFGSVSAVNVNSIQTAINAGITASYSMVTGVTLTGGVLRFTTTTLNFGRGVLTSSGSGSNIDIATSTCP